MSKYDYDYDDDYSPSSKKPSLSSFHLDVWDMLSILVILAIVGVAIYALAVFSSPTAPFNPLNPIRDLPPTATITQIQPPATWTPTPLGPTETPFPTPMPTFTLEASPTVVSLITPSVTPIPPTPTATPKAPFSGTVTYIDSSIIHPEAACNWQGVAGTILNAKGADMIGVTVRLVGYYDSKTKSELTVSGIAPAYGKSGFEFFLGTTPQNSNNLLTIQILDQSAIPLSDAIPINTYADCGKNLILVKFKENAK
ncbi:MAG: hypothetical protein LC099_09620 [Anaerolineales bacterium]|nr:hypothetical protein [Anaerolineales bacterium]